MEYHVLLLQSAARPGTLHGWSAPTHPAAKDILTTAIRSWPECCSQVVRTLFCIPLDIDRGLPSIFYKHRDAALAAQLTLLER